jgi:hypothetical protein
MPRYQNIYRHARWESLSMSALDYRNAHKSKNQVEQTRPRRPPHRLTTCAQENNSDETPWWGSWMAPMTVIGPAAKEARRKICSRKEHDCRADPESPEIARQRRTHRQTRRHQRRRCDREQSRWSPQVSKRISINIQEWPQRGHSAQTNEAL